MPEADRPHQTPSARSWFLADRDRKLLEYLVQAQLQDVAVCQLFYRLPQNSKPYCVVGPIGKAKMSA
jgi:hypothetical protein